ncbi:MAG TPA: SagB/ThcOx family dehydrogenase, partial [bacterium]|nr:SagB/ThcOx family dehydrogenase [bacterium]
MQWHQKPPQFKTYPGLDLIGLPRELPNSPSAPLDVAGLGWMLFLSAGVVRVLQTAHGPMWFRAAGSAGNLSPVEVYVVTGDAPGLAAGVYHYQPLAHGLVHLRAVPPSTPPALVLTGVPWRTAWKYTERAFRHLYWDAGTMLSHTLELAAALRLGPAVEVGFVDVSVAALVGADGTHELPLAVVALENQSSLPDPD